MPQTTYTFVEHEVEKIIRDHVVKTYSVPEHQVKVRVEVNPGTPYGNQMDPGTPAYAKVVAVVDPSTRIPPDPH